MRSLQTRRLEIITRFSKKALLNEKHQNWFCKMEPQSEPKQHTRQKAKPLPLLKPVTCRTDRYARSSLPFITRLLSWHPPLVYTPPRPDLTPQYYPTRARSGLFTDLTIYLYGGTSADLSKIPPLLRGIVICFRR